MKSKAHQRYKNKDGVGVPGVTTITGQLGWNKQQLISWSNKLGLQGIESSKFRDDKADIGTLAHLIVTSHILGTKPDTKDYSANQISQAENCALSYFEWAKARKIEPILVETWMVSELYQYGGTPDFYGKVDGVFELIDYKSGKGIYPEYSIQVAAYRQLLIEAGKPVDKVRIINIPRSEDESFQEKIITNLDEAWQAFLALRTLYGLKKALEGKE
jgi:hypothetical protein